MTGGKPTIEAEDMHNTFSQYGKSHFPRFEAIRNSVSLTQRAPLYAANTGASTRRAKSDSHPELKIHLESSTTLLNEPGKIPRQTIRASRMNPSTHDLMQASPSPESELPAVGFLKEVAPDHRAFLACFGRFLRPQPGETLITEGDRQESLYVILSGTLHIVSNAANRQMLLASLAEGDSMGEVNVFDPGTASATAVARSSGLIWVLSRDELNGFLEADPVAGVAVLKGLLREVSYRIRAMNEKLATAEQRASMHNFWTTGPQ
jgi:CRP/FNR family cyclic AMP-dependent transcriptional regulator